MSIYYGWKFALLALLLMAVVNAPVFQGSTVWFVAFKHQFGWSSGQLAWAFALARIEGGLFGPVEGILVDKLGSKRMILIGLMVVGVGFLMLSQVQHLWQLYVSYVIIAGGAGMGTWLACITVINNWFSERRAFAMSIATSGFFAGSIVLIPVISWAIDPQEERLGWRLTTGLLGAGIALMAFPISRFVHNKPSQNDPGMQKNSQVDVKPNRVENGTLLKDIFGESAGFTLFEALRTKQFWLITGGHSLSSGVAITIAVHLGLMMDDRGYSLGTTGWIVSVYGVVGFGLFGFSFLQSIAVIILVYTDSLWTVYLFAILLGIGFGGRSPLTSAVRGVYFGRLAFASILGVSAIFLNLALFTAPLYAGYMRDFTGGYEMPFTVVAVVGIVGSALFLFLGKPELPAQVVVADGNST